jgi:hypothetical protein
MVPLSQAGKMELVKQVYDIGYFFRAVQVQMRFGELSRANLRLLRLELKGERVECAWIARAADEWDDLIAVHARENNVSTQALMDAICVRELLFSSLPGTDTASFRVFRESNAGDLELIVTGTVMRVQPATRNVSSLAMRAKLLGLQFCLEDGILEALPSEEFAMSF